jgi:hypothetical protein
MDSTSAKKMTDLPVKNGSAFPYFFAGPDFHSGLRLIGFEDPADGSKVHLWFHISSMLQL